MAPAQPTPESIISFWREAGRKRWFESDPKFDVEVRSRFLAAHEAAAEGKLADWRNAADGTLALLLLLDQFPRNMFRGTARAFATDTLARALARGAIERGFDRMVEPALRGFFYLPLMHSEDLGDQQDCADLYRAAGDADGLKWAEIHLDVIRRFGRFPHRNKVLGRTSTPEELAFLEGGGFGA